MVFHYGNGKVTNTAPKARQNPGDKQHICCLYSPSVFPIKKASETLEFRCHPVLFLETESL